MEWSSTSTSVNKARCGYLPLCSFCAVLPLLAGQGGEGEMERGTAAYGLGDGTDEGNRVWLHLQGPDAFNPEDDCEPDGFEFAFERAHQHQRLFGSYAAHGSGRGAAFSGGYAALCPGRLAVFRPLVLLLVEGRPQYFLPALCVKGGSCSSARHPWFHGSLAVPSDFVPGGDEVLVWKMQSTRLLSPSGVPGPLCKRQGQLCNFRFPLDRHVKCSMLIVIYV
jgi:hypothetical protein